MYNKQHKDTEKSHKGYNDTTFSMLFSEYVLEILSLVSLKKNVKHLNMAHYDVKSNSSWPSFL